MNKHITITAAFFGLLAVMLGAMGAHAMKAVLTPAHMETWQTAVQYHFYHVFALLFLSTLSRFKSKLISASYYLFVLGIVCFSGSLYLLSCREAFHLNWVAPKVFGPITPLGGVFFMAGWITLGFAAYRNR